MKRILILSLLFVLVGVVAFQTGVYYQFQRLFSVGHPPAHDFGSKNSTTTIDHMEVNVIINYGNSTIVWFNQTKASQGWNFYNLTLILANGRVHSAFFSDLHEHQILGINGVEQNTTYYWSLWKFCSTYNAWAWSSVGADQIVLSNRGIYGWYYQVYPTQGSPSPPVEGAKTIVVLDMNSC